MGNEIFEKLSRIVTAKNIPLYSVFELTHRCNLICRHCYLDSAGAKNELPEAKIKYILGELARAGCLHLGLTGGEVFLRKDFLRICSYARKLNFDVRVFTNGTLIKRSDAQFLAEIGIGGVELSLYGKKDTHDRITRVSGSFDMTFAAIKLLKEYRVNVRIKAPIMKLNYGDYHWLLDFSKRLGLECIFDPVLAPKNNGDRSVLKSQLGKSGLRKVFSDRKLIPARPARKNSAAKPPDINLFCGAGRDCAGIAPDGTVYPCIQFLYPLGNLKKKSFDEIWYNSKRADYVRGLKSSDCKECFSCSKAAQCRRCPGLALLESKDILGKSEIACQLAEAQA